ncbi:hypothetical protein [Algisphaera agarilytica]|uniref:PEP-CTERM protein-sorting domain-containing protein n=1 Tax=Algisphaera agarilytica TaxID=1385975 RepID=A0A7X0H7L8_9BACT|nr:hypothetical protein [Algisphaera agarilytica]MBB6429295.1 hypothetical protein [Algisphaera agarilytica]
MKRIWAGMGVAVMCVSAWVAPAKAVDRDPSSFVWLFSDTGYAAQGTGLAMSRGKAWPVVFGTSDTFTLRPTSGGTFGGFWSDVAAPLGFGPIRTASSSNGSVAGVNFFGNNNGGYIVGPTGTSTTLSSGIVAVDYTASGVLVTATENSVNGFVYDGQFGIQDIAVSPFGDGGVLRNGEFYSTLTNDAISLTFATGTTYTGLGSLVFDAQGRPHVVDREGNAFSFETNAGGWSATSLGTVGNTNSRLPIAADSTGTVGTAYVNNNSELIYAYWTASAGWQSTLVALNADQGFQIGLDFDYEDLPVISYVDLNSGNVVVAYDPIAVPEPSVAVVCGLMSGLLLRRRVASMN